MLSESDFIRIRSVSIFTSGGEGSQRDGDGQPGKLVWAIHVSHTGTNVEDNSNVRSLFEPSTFFVHRIALLCAPMHMSFLLNAPV